MPPLGTGDVWGKCTGKAEARLAGVLAAGTVISASTVPHRGASIQAGSEQTTVAYTV